MRYTFTGDDWKIHVRDVYDKYSIGGIKMFVERHHKYLSEMDVDDSCTADILMDNAVCPAFVRKISNDTIALCYPTDVFENGHLVKEG